MARMVNCRKYGKEMEGLDSLPFPGELGEDIFANVSRQAWEDWQKHQTRLINEKQLDMRDSDSRRFLQEQMKRFLRGEEFEQAENYVPEEGEDSK